MTEPPRRLDSIATRWSLVRAAHGQAAPSATEARQALVLRYSQAIRAYIGAMTRDRDQADELAHDVVVRLLRGDFGGADPDRGRFRDLLKVAVRNMVRNHWAKEQRRRPQPHDLEAVADRAGDHDEAPWTAAWSRNVLELAWAQLAEYESAHSGRYPHTLLRLRVEHPGDSSEQLAERLAARLGRAVRADAVRQQLRRARVRFAELLVFEIADGLERPSPERVEDELVALGLIEHVRDVLPDDWKERLLK